jgi:Tfp pilus assembly protein PilN
MKELYKRTPEDVIYQSVYWTEEGEWILQGYAQTRSGVNNLQSGLIDSSWFQDVQLDYATKRKLGNVDVTDFRIHCRIADKARGPS